MSTIENLADLNPEYRELCSAEEIQKKILANGNAIQRVIAAVKLDEIRARKKQIGNEVFIGNPT